FVDAEAEPPFERAILADMPPAPLTRTIRALIRGDHKLIHYVAENHFLLFNLTEDPAEKRNLMKVDPARARALQQELKGHFAVTLKVRQPTGMREALEEDGGSDDSDKDEEETPKARKKPDSVQKGKDDDGDDTASP